jgi:hypothetical protein
VKFNRSVWLAVALAVTAAALIYRAGSQFRTTTADAAHSAPAKTGDPFFDSAPPGRPSDAELARAMAAIESERKRWDETIWATEIIAERHEEVITRLWDELRGVDDEYAVLGSFPFGELNLGKPGPAETLDHGITRTRLDLTGEKMDAEEWKRRLDRLKAQGFRLEQSEWRHARFDWSTNAPARSVFAVTLHIANPRAERRIIVRGDLHVEWRPDPDPEAAPFPRTITATNLEMLERTGPPVFKHVVAKEIAPAPDSIFIDPLILYDLDGDGLSEIILGCVNQVYWNRGDGRFEPSPLCDQPPLRMNAGLVADFNGDGAADFLCCDGRGLLFYAGDRRGRFTGEGQRAWSSPYKLLNPFVMTCGDIDGDHDLDVWLGQYKLPYYAGQMPTPYYDANDGFPSFLLVNDGNGGFREATAEAGLSKKRFRRTYSSSFVDLDDDGDLDLVVVSDFAGADVYDNDGHGHFTEVTSRVLDEPHAFGMAHSFADFDGDGRPDFLMIGMNSFVARRLDHLGAGPVEFPLHQVMRTKMGYGNRLYLRRGDAYRQTSLSEDVARTGWSWGCTAFDFDNDGDLDLYVANGHKSRQSARDYETQFWRHDIYAAGSRHDPALDAYFGATGDRLYGSGQSYGGYEKNRLLMNRSGRAFVDVAWLMDVAVENDCRNLVSDDLDGDGKPDLILTTFEEWPEHRQALHVFRNTGTQSGNWIGVRLRENGGGYSPVGARVILRAASGDQVRCLVTGDSYRSQHAFTAHFGLGRATRVEALEVQWPNGQITSVKTPAINAYVEVRSGKQETESSR